MEAKTTHFTGEENGEKGREIERGKRGEKAM
jgi:hypothetical protein